MNTGAEHKVTSFILSTPYNRYVFKFIEETFNQCFCPGLVEVKLKEGERMEEVRMEDHHRVGDQGTEDQEIEDQRMEDTLPDHFLHSEGAGRE